jgi:predicted phosphodiesterase
VRIGLLADVHGNAIALERCLATVKAMNVDALHLIGDLVGYLPGEQACLQMLQGEGVDFQRGNHEEMLVAPSAEAAARDDVYQLAAVRARMSPTAMRAIAAWPRRRELMLAGRRVLLVHGSPEDPLCGYVYPDSDLSRFQALPYQAVLMAHTHRPFVACIGDTVVANVGSVGLPRDVGALSSLAVYDSDANDVEIYRVPLDAKAVLARWGDRMHAATRACLHRSAAEFVGRVIA